jgi:hypothetical protein
MIEPIADSTAHQKALRRIEKRPSMFRDLGELPDDPSTFVSALRRDRDPLDSAASRDETCGVGSNVS